MAGGETKAWCFDGGPKGKDLDGMVWSGMEIVQEGSVGCDFMIVLDGGLVSEMCRRPPRLLLLMMMRMGMLRMKIRMRNDNDDGGG